MGHGPLDCLLYPRVAAVAAVVAAVVAVAVAAAAGWVWLCWACGWKTEVQQWLLRWLKERRCWSLAVAALVVWLAVAAGADGDAGLEHPQHWVLSAGYWEVLCRDCQHMAGTLPEHNSLLQLIYRASLSFITYSYTVKYVFI